MGVGYETLKKLKRRHHRRRDAGLRQQQARCRRPRRMARRWKWPPACARMIGYPGGRADHDRAGLSRPDGRL
jgi:hypothetical protein